jgi:hypothetical protein
MRWSWLSLCSATANLSGCPSRMCRLCSLFLVSMDQPVCQMYTWPHSQGMLYTHGVLSLRSYITGRRKLEIFLGGKPTLLMLCLASMLLRRLYVVWTYGRRGLSLSQARLLITTRSASFHIESTLQVADFLSFLLALLTREVGTDTLYRNVGKQLPHDVA